MDQARAPVHQGPLKGLEEGDNFVKVRYVEGAPAAAKKKPEEFRNYSDSAPECVKEFYRCSKSDELLKVEELRPYHENLIAQYVPPQLDW